MELGDNGLCKYKWDASQPGSYSLMLTVPLPSVWLAQQAQVPKVLLPVCAEGWTDHPACGLQHSGDGSVEPWALHSQHCSHALDEHLGVTNNHCYNWLKSKRGTDGSQGKHLTLRLTEGSSKHFTATRQRGMCPCGIVIYALFLAIWGTKSLLGCEWSFQASRWGHDVLRYHFEIKLVV